MVQSSGFRVWGLGFRVEGLGVRVVGLGCRGLGSPEMKQRVPAGRSGWSKGIQSVFADDDTCMKSDRE